MRKLMILFLLFVGVGAFAQNRVNSKDFVDAGDSGYYFETEDGVLYLYHRDGSSWPAGSGYYNFRPVYLVKYPQYKQGSTFTIPAGVETIAKSAFQGNQYIQTIKIPSSVKYIAQDAFADCPNLKSIEMYDSATNIPAYEEEENTESTEVGRYNIQGVKVEESTDGVQIILYSDGSTKKILK